MNRILRPGLLSIFAITVIVSFSNGCTSQDGKIEEMKPQEIKEKKDQKTEEMPQNPLEARYANDENLKLAKKMSLIAKDIKPEDAPDYVKKMVEHMKNVTKIFKENVDDCDKTAAALKKYVQDNKADLEAIRKQGDEAQAKMDEEQKSKLSTQTILLLGPIAKDLAFAQARFVKNCRDQAEDIAKAMQAVVGD